MVCVNRNMRRSLKLEVVTQTCGHTSVVAISCSACTKRLTKWHRKVDDNIAVIVRIKKVYAAFFLIEFRD